MKNEMEWRMYTVTANSLTCVTGVVQSKLSYLLCLRGSLEAVSASSVLLEYFWSGIMMSESENGLLKIGFPSLDPSAASKQLMTSYSSLHGGHTIAYHCQRRQMLWELGMITSQSAQMRIRLKIKHWFLPSHFCSQWHFITAVLQSQSFVLCLRVRR